MLSFGRSERGGGRPRIVGGRRGAARAFADVAFGEPDLADVERLAALAMRGDADHARWELRYARRALAVLVAERRAHDDRTASLVAAAVHDRLIADPNVAPESAGLAARQFNDRLAAYRDAFRARSAESAPTRLARVLLVFAGSVRAARGEGITIAADQIARTLGVLDAAFERAFGIERVDAHATGEPA